MTHNMTGYRYGLAMPQQNAACNASHFYAISERCINGLSPNGAVMWLPLPVVVMALASAFTNQSCMCVTVQEMSRLTQ